MLSDVECGNNNDAKERGKRQVSPSLRLLPFAWVAVLASLLPQVSLSQTALLTKDGCSFGGGFVYDQLLKDMTTSNALTIVLRRDSDDVRRQLGIDIAKLSNKDSEIYNIKNGWVATFYLRGEAVFSLGKVAVAMGSFVATATPYFDDWGAKLDVGVAIDGLNNAGEKSILYDWGGGEDSAPPDEIIIASTCANLIGAYQYSPNGQQWENFEKTKTYLETLDGLTDSLGANSMSSCTWVLTSCLEK